MAPTSQPPSGSRPMRDSGGSSLDTTWRAVRKGATAETAGDAEGSMEPGEGRGTTGPGCAPEGRWGSGPAPGACPPPWGLRLRVLRGLRGGPSSRDPRPARGPRLGDLAIEEAYIYPRPAISLRRSFNISYMRQGG